MGFVQIQNIGKSFRPTGKLVSANWITQSKTTTDIPTWSTHFREE